MVLEDDVRYAVKKTQKSRKGKKKKKENSEVDLMVYVSKFIEDHYDKISHSDLTFKCMTIA